MELLTAIICQLELELEVSDEIVLLCNEDMWHIVLHDGYYGDACSEEDFKIENQWFDDLPAEERETVKRKSWEKIFAVSPPQENDWDILRSSNLQRNPRFFRGESAGYC